MHSPSLFQGRQTPSNTSVWELSIMHDSCNIWIVQESAQMMLKSEVTQKLATIFPESDPPITVGFRVFHSSGFEKFHLLRYNAVCCHLLSCWLLAWLILQP
jgi:hypothetical protein